MRVAGVARKTLDVVYAGWVGRQISGELSLMRREVAVQSKVHGASDGVEVEYWIGGGGRMEATVQVRPAACRDGYILPRYDVS